jgi:hypothetical protein
MTTADIIALVAALFAGGSTVAGAIYMRGQLDGHAKASAKKLEEFGRKIDALEEARLKEGEDRGAQGVLNQNAANTALEARLARELSIKVEERQSAHEKGCDRRQTAIWERFDKTDARIDHLSAEIRNLALGLANGVTELPPSAIKRIG